MLEIIEEKSNISLNRLDRMRIKNSIILLDMIIFQKLFKISICNILISHNLAQIVIKKDKKQ